MIANHSSNLFTWSEEVSAIEDDNDRRVAQLLWASRLGLKELESGEYFQAWRKQAVDSFQASQKWQKLGDR